MNEGGEMSESKPGEFKVGGATLMVHDIWVCEQRGNGHEGHYALSPSDPDAIPAAEAFLAAAKEAANPWVEWGKNGQGFRVRKDGTDAQFRVDGGSWVEPRGLEEEFNGYRAALRAHGIGD